MHLKLTLAYDGTGFRGWARQPGERTVEGVLGDGARDALRLATSASRSPGAPTRASTRSRTSSRSRSTGGAAARARRRGAERAPARGSRGRPRRRGARRASTRATRPRSRSYRYRIWRRRVALAVRDRTARSGIPAARPRSACTPRPRCSSASTTSGPSPRPRPSTRPSCERSRTRAGTTGATPSSSRSPPNSFLRHMVRTLVGTMLELEPDRIVDLLQGAPRSEAGSTAAAAGLYLVEVDYDGNGDRGGTPLR